MCGENHANSETPNVKSRATLCEDDFGSSRRRTTMEEWKSVELGGMTYRVSSHGNVESVRGRITPRSDKDGYLVITVGKLKCRRVVKVHRLVAQLFIPNPNNLPEVNHVDRDRKNPKVTNLEWVTHKGNIDHSVKQGSYGKIQQGVNNNKAKLSEEDVEDIRMLFDNGIMTQKELAEAYEVGWSTIHNIVFRMTWTHII